MGRRIKVFKDITLKYWFSVFLVFSSNYLLIQNLHLGCFFSKFSFACQRKSRDDLRDFGWNTYIYIWVYENISPFGCGTISFASLYNCRRTQVSNCWPSNPWLISNRDTKHDNYYQLHSHVFSNFLWIYEKYLVL